MRSVILVLLTATHVAGQDLFEQDGPRPATKAELSVLPDGNQTAERRLFGDASDSCVSCCTTGSCQMAFQGTQPGPKPEMYGMGPMGGMGMMGQPGYGGGYGGGGGYGPGSLMAAGGAGLLGGLALGEMMGGGGQPMGGMDYGGGYPGGGYPGGGYPGGDGGMFMADGTGGGGFGGGYGGGYAY